MLNNCTIRQQTDLSHYPEYIYDFFGNSMVPSIALFDKAILDGDEISCIKNDLVPTIDNGTFEINGKGIYVVHPFFEKEFAASITGVNFEAQAIKLSFPNPDKSLYPDIVLRTYEITSLYRICGIGRWSPAAKSGCHCAVDGDWCGDGCTYPQNKESVLAIEKGGRNG